MKKNQVKMVIGDKFNTSGAEAKGFKVIRRIKLLSYDEKKGYCVKTVQTGNVWEVKMSKVYKGAPVRQDLSGCIGIHGGVSYLDLSIR